MTKTFCSKHCRFGRRILFVSLIAGFLSVSIPLSAVENSVPGPGVRSDAGAGGDQVESFYQASKEGWFWYQDPQPEPEPPEAPDLPAQVDPDQPMQTNPAKPTSWNLDDYTMDDLWNMYPDDFQELLDHVQKVAVQKPTEENVLKYLSIQDVARRKALAYTHATMFVAQKYNDRFNTAQVYPTSAPGVDARVQMQQEEIAVTIARAKDNHALIYFSKTGCGFCEKQTQILAYFAEQYGWQVKEVNIAQNPGAAARFNVTVTPTLLLVRKGDEKSLAISTGVVTLSELERSLYRSIRYLQGETKDDNFLLYDYQKNSPLDPASIFKQGSQPWKTAY